MLLSSSWNISFQVNIFQNSSYLYDGSIITQVIYTHECVPVTIDCYYEERKLCEIYAYD